ncbi:MAG: efflux RND transporter permease subunit [Candidatus Eisenbacteria bacterium]
MTMPIVASTLTTVAVFLPVSFVRGPIGTLLRDLSLSVCVSLAMSVLVSLTFLPMLVGRFGGKPPTVERKPLYGLYHRTLEACLARPRRFLAAIAVVLVASAAVLLSLPREILPEVAIEEVELALRLPPGHDLSATDAVVQSMEGWLDQREEVSQVFAAVGAAAELDPTGAERERNRASLRIRLKPRALARRDALLHDFLTAWNGRSGVEIEVEPDRPELMSLLPSGDATLTCELQGPDPAEAEKLAEEIRAGAQSTLAQSGQPLKLLRAEYEPRYRLSLKEDALWRHGLNESEVLDAVEARTSGLDATTLRRFDEEHPVVVREANDAPPSEGDLVVAGRRYPIDALFAVRAEAAPALLLREDQARIVAIRWDGAMRDVAAVKQALERSAAGVGLPPGYSVRFGGAWQTMRRTLSGILWAFALSAGLVVLILAAQFESVKLPLLVFASVPLSLIGVAIGLLVTGESVSALAAIGLVILVGVVDNEAILKVEFLRQLVERGHTAREAVRIASRDRYRSILMTTVTNLLGLIPMYFGRGAELRAPMATVLIGGLTSGAILTLLVIPVLFDLLAGREERRAVRAGIAR